MAAVVTENWSDYRWQRGVRGSRAFVITGVASETEARTALATYGVAFNGQFPTESRLRADEPDVGQLGPAGQYRASVEYTRSDQGEKTAREDDPLDEPPKIMWEPGILSEPSDVDAYANPIVNTAYFPLEGGASAEVMYGVLTVTKVQSTFDVSMMFAFANKVNSDTVAIPLAGTVAPGQMLCRSIRPTHEYDQNATYVRVAYQFWVRQGNLQDTDGLYDSWKHRLLNAGRMGRWNNGGTKTVGPFVSADAAGRGDGRYTDRPEPTLLTSAGVPFDATAWVLGGAGTDPLTTKAPVAPATGMVVATTLLESTTNAVFLKYYKHKSAAFAGLNIFS